MFLAVKRVAASSGTKVTGIVELVGLIVVAYTWRDESEFEIVRIISARQAERRERRTYEEGDDG